jgi:hypothetical protein
MYFMETNEPLYASADGYGAWEEALRSKASLELFVS